MCGLFFFLFIDGTKKEVQLTSSFLSVFLFILQVTTSTPVSDGLAANIDSAGEITMKRRSSIFNFNAFEN
tara:strand:- start:992 stop:1201 length:210 start_codon:yes stop_codon:yes gene_type:complete